jgi:hypothetical protein
MPGKFLTQLFVSAEFPVPVREYVINTYAPVCLLDIAKNPAFRGWGALLFNPNLPEDKVRVLLDMGDPSIVEAILSSTECREKVLGDVLKRWYLSPADQFRLAQKVTSQNFAGALLRTYALADEARSKLIVRSNQKWTPGRIMDHHEVSTSREQYRKPYAGLSVRANQQTYEKFTLSFLSDKDLRDISMALECALGDGASAESMEQWSAFFILANHDCSVPLKTVLDTARRLAFAEK